MSEAEQISAASAQAPGITDHAKKNNSTTSVDQGKTTKLGIDAKKEVDISEWYR